MANSSSPVGTPMSKLAYTVEETATTLSLGRNSTLELIHSKRLRSVRVGKRILVPHAEILRFLEQEVISS